MKLTKILCGAVILTGFTAMMSSCESEEKRLAREVTGVWSGTPEEVTDNAAVTATISETYYFAPDSAFISNGKFPIGPLTIESMMSMSTQVVAEGDGVMPIGLTASAIASARGTWTVVDDEEISISIDPSTISVSVDPSTMTTSPDGNASAAPATMPDEMKTRLEQSLTRALATRYGGMKLLEDVKVKGTLMKYEIGHMDYVLTRRSEKLGN
ncbi:MAG: hypothetical protein NC039_07940 [Muribaculaceae bacterium]|nr:hypothetical protein [Muribaculaceae bacterium]